MNYGQLKQAVRDYAHRDVSDAQLGTFLALAEQRIYLGEANTPALRIAAMRKRVALGDGTRPVDFLQATKIEDGSGALAYTPFAALPKARRAFAWDGPTLVLSDDVIFPVTLTYFGKLVTPAADADTSWLLDNAPGVYLSAVLVEFARWALDGEMLARETANYTSAVQTLMSQDRAAAVSGSVLIGSPA